MGQGRLVCEPLGAPQLREFVKLWRPSQSDQTPQELGSIRPHRVTFRAFSRATDPGYVNAPRRLGWTGEALLGSELLGEDQVDLLAGLVEKLDGFRNLFVRAGLADLLRGVHQREDRLVEIDAWT